MVEHLVVGEVDVMVRGEVLPFIVFAFSDLEKRTPEQLVLQELNYLLWSDYFFAKLFGQTKVVEIRQIRLDNLGDKLLYEQVKKK